MKKSILIIVVLASIVQSCTKASPYKSSRAVSTYQNKVVLSAFQDTVATPTLNMDLLKDLPKVVNLSSSMTSVKNQSNRGTCTLFTTMGILEAAIKKDLHLEVNLSEEYLNYETKSTGHFPDDEGSQVGADIEGMQSGGILLERDWSYEPTWFGKGLPCEGYENTDTSAPSYCYSHYAPDASTLKKVISTQGIKFGSIEKDTNAIIRFLAEKRRPLILAVTINYAGWPDNGNAYYDETLRQECLNGTAECGGHSIILTGYDLNKKVFFFKNSWGKEWGQDGYGTLTFESVDNYFDVSPLYYVNVDKSFKLPSDYNKDYLSVENFDTLVRSGPNALGVDIKTNVHAISGRFLYISSFLVKKNNLKDTTFSDANTQTLSYDDAEAANLGEKSVKLANYTIPSSQSTLDSLSWNPLKLDFTLQAMQTKTISDLINSPDNEGLLRSTIYVYTDDSMYKTLARNYYSLK
jgi:hypothetical protein